MIRGWVQLINVSVLPRAWLQLHSPELRGAQPASDRARGTSFPDHERGGGVLDQTRARNPDTGIRSAGQGQDETLKYHQ